MTDLFKPFQTIREVIIKVMGNDWFSQPRHRIQNHPAFKSIELCDHFIERNGIGWPLDMIALRYFLKLVVEVDFYDNVSNVARKDDDLLSMSLGNFQSYGDIEVRKRLKSIVKNPTDFKSLTTEIAFASMAKHQYELEPTEREGKPDFIIRAGVSCFQVECKCIIENPSKKAIQRAISKSNKQFKAGIVGVPNVTYLDLCESLQIEQFAIGTRKNFSFNGETIFEDGPNISYRAIVEIKKHIINSFNGMNSRVSGVLLSWYEFRILSPGCQSCEADIKARRRCELIENPSARWPLENFSSDLFNTSFVMNLNLGKRWERTRNSICPIFNDRRLKHCCGSLKSS